jgi:hypothetical protein
MAESAVCDLERNFWSGTATNGHFNAGCGLLAPYLDTPAALWKDAQAYNVLYGWWKLSGDPDAKARLAANWKWVKNALPRSDWQLCGWGTPINFASDDTGWNASMALQAYDVTQDPQALADAEAAVDAAFARWRIDGSGGALWYNDARKVSSLYQATLALDSYRIFGLTGLPRFLLYAMSTYYWITDNLERPDGLYWCEYASGAPVGGDRPDQIHPADSVTFLEGNMAMALLNARLYRATRCAGYSESAIRTSLVLLARETDGNGILVDDRDAWTDGYLVREWAEEVLPLSPALAGGARAVCRTAAAVYGADRTAYGCYGGDWSGAGVWSLHNTVPEQVMTSANAANNIIAAASLQNQPPSTNWLRFTWLAP